MQTLAIVTLHQVVLLHRPHPLWRRHRIAKSLGEVSTGSFVATSEWVSIGVSTFASNRGMELSPKKCKEMVISFLKYSLLCRKLVISYYIKNRAVDLRFTIIDTCEIIMNIYVRLSILLMARKSIKHPLLYNYKITSIPREHWLVNTRVWVRVYPRQFPAIAFFKKPTVVIL